MYQELEMWNAEMAKTIKWIKENKKSKQSPKQERPSKDALLSAALAECFAMGVQDNLS